MGPFWLRDSQTGALQYTLKVEMAFIVFEGLDGTGKSTLIRGLADELKAQGISFTLTREPGGTPLGEEIRNLLLRIEGDSPSTRCELLLYEAIRAQHVDQKIRPELQKGNWVLSDRYSASTVAFQVGGRGLELTDINWLNNYTTKGCQPDLWVLLDLSIEGAFERMDRRSQQGKDRFERENSDFHERVRQKYLEMAQGQPNWLQMDAQKPVEELKRILIDKLRNLGFLN